MPLLLLLLLLAPLWAGTIPQGQHLSITSVEGTALAPEQLELFAQVLEGRITSTGKWTVLERRNIGNILNEQGFQQSGACNTTECQVKIGELLGVEVIVMGQIQHADQTWFLNLRATDVGSGKIIASANRTISGDFNAVLDEGMSLVLEDLFGVVAEYKVAKPGMAALRLTREGDGSLLVHDVSLLSQAFEVGVVPGMKILTVNGKPPRKGMEQALGEEGTISALGLLGEDGKSVQQVSLLLHGKGKDDALFAENDHRMQGGAWSWVGLEFGVGGGVAYGLYGLQSLVRLSPFPYQNPLNFYVGSGIQFSPWNPENAFTSSAGIELALTKTRLRFLATWYESFEKNSYEEDTGMGPVRTVTTEDNHRRMFHYELQTIDDIGEPGGAALVFGLGYTYQRYWEFDSLDHQGWMPFLLPTLAFTYRIGG